MHPTTTPSGTFVTHPSLYVRNARDAHIVLEAVRLRILPLIRRRLVAKERESLSTGNVFVWEEGEEEGGLLRWTDGRRWSQSRMHGDYLTYEEKIELTPEEKEAKASRRIRRASDPTTQIGPAFNRKDRPSKPNGLTKQTYSTLVHLPGTNQTRKWHLVAYFSGNDYSHLPIIENYDYLRRIRVPEGVFVNSRSSASRVNSPDSPVEETDHVYRNKPKKVAEAYPLQPIVSSTSTYASSIYHDPQTLSLPISGEQGQMVSLPPLSTLGYPRRPDFSHNNGVISSPENYTPLSTEDRRALERLRISL